ncbi:MAG: uroporphyrinogen-III synthase [Burkholderiaceae bacterium]
MAAFILNQPQPRASLAADKLRADGHGVVELAFHRLEPIADELTRLSQIDITVYDRIVFASPSSVAFSVPALAGKIGDDLASPRVAAIGQGTATVLLETGLIADDASIIRPRRPPFDSAALVQLPLMQPGVIESLLVIRGQQGRTDWIESYQQAGVRVTCVPIYRSQLIAPSSQVTDTLSNLICNGAAAVIVVGSVSEFTALLHWLTAANDKRLLGWMQNQLTVVPHARIGTALTKAGWTDIRPTMAGQTLLNAALELAS